MRILTKEIVMLEGEAVELMGWVAGRRDHGKLVFIDLRDRGGVVQVVFLPSAKEAYPEAQKLRAEWVVRVRGTVAKRPENMRNSAIVTGDFEIQASDLLVLNQAETPPFPLDTDGHDIDEETRLKYRYLDLRRSRLQKNLKLRHQVIHFMRNFLSDRSFVEVETPVLGKSTPEGARDYLVPSRVYPGKFYALPQSPQQYKQLLMVAGLERYFQIARCFRDEDSRGDRQPEFTQLDLEMSFVVQEDVLSLTEELLIKLVGAVAPEKHITAIPFPRMSWKEAMEKHKTDKPDLRKDKNDPNELSFMWIIDFPLFEKDKEGKMTAAHHPFSRPNPEDEHMLDTDPYAVRSWCYDIVLNQYELGSGSIRINNSEMQKKIFRMLGLSDKKIDADFGHMLQAFEFGAPPHGGIAPGIDRLIMILSNEPNIRETIAFPKTGDGRDPMMDAPSVVDPSQLKELGIVLAKKTKDR
jgi:aspartyl-tRNA synthetase